MTGLLNLAAVLWQCTSTSKAMGFPVHARQQQPAAFQLVAQPMIIHDFG